MRYQGLFARHLCMALAMVILSPFSSGFLPQPFMDLRRIGHLQTKTATTAQAIRLRNGSHRHGRFIFAASAQAKSDSEVHVVPKILELIQNTDRGADATALPLPRRLELYSNLNMLEEEGTDKDYFGGDGGHGLGMFEVSFVGESKATKEVNQTASSQAGGYVAVC